MRTGWPLLEVDKHSLQWLTGRIQPRWHIDAMNVLTTEQMGEHLEHPLLRDVVEHTRDADAGVGFVNLSGHVFCAECSNHSEKILNQFFFPT